jgi:hypothetical protein
MNVTIPNGYFLQQSQNEYSDYQLRLVQELFQNSVDARATEIYLDFNGEGYSMKDNGKGMSRDTMINAMLTFGGSQKEDGDTGGFGHAKILLLFSMDNYSIESNGVKTTGSGLVYEPLFDVEYRRGTIVTGKFPAKWHGNAEYMVEKAKSLLSKCQLRAAVYINGERFTDWKYAKRSTRSNEWSKLYSHKVDVDNYYINVRKNGLFMFEKWVGATKKEIILEITASSKEVLTANRDGFKSKYDKEFSTLYAEICTDKNSFDREKVTKHHFKGEKSFYSLAFTRSEEVRYSEPEVFTFIQNIKVLAEEKKLPDLEAMLVQTYGFVGRPGLMARQVVEDAIQFVKKTLQTDFVIDLADSGINEIPKRWNPATMAVSNQIRAKLWRAALDLVFEANELEADFRIGFTLRKDSIAQYGKDEDVEEFLIHPDVELWDKDKWSKCYELLITACHEISHRDNKYHDENFILTEERLLGKVLASIKGDMNAITKKAKTYTL